MRTTNQEAARHFLVELNRPDEGWQDVAEVTARARLAAPTSPSGSGARFVRSVYAPESDSLFLVYRGATAKAVLETVRAADLDPLGASAALDSVGGGRR